MLILKKKLENSEYLVRFLGVDSVWKKDELEKQVANGNVALKVNKPLSMKDFNRF